MQPSVSYTSIVGGTQAYRSASGQVRVIIATDGFAYYEMHLDKNPSCMSR